MVHASFYILEPDTAARRTAMHHLTVLGMEVRHFTSPTDLLAALDHEVPAVVMSEMNTPEMTGLELQWMLLRDHPSVSLIFTVAEPRICDVVEAMKHGAVDCLNKPLAASELLRAANEAVALARSWHQLEQKRRRVSGQFQQLSERERDVFPYLIQGLANKEIAAELAMSLRSVEHHRHLIFEKFQVNNAPQLAGLVSLLKATSPRCQGLSRSHHDMNRPMPKCMEPSCRETGDTCPPFVKVNTTFALAR